MLRIILEGPQASGKTLMRAFIETEVANVTAKTGHAIEIQERLTDYDLVALKEGPCFKVLRFKPSGKFDTEFNFIAPLKTNMQQVCDLLRATRKLPEGYSMVISEALNQQAETFFYPCEVK